MIKISIFVLGKLKTMADFRTPERDHTRTIRRSTGRTQALYENAERMQRKKQALKEQQELAGCTFCPRTNARLRSSSSTPPQSGERFENLFRQAAISEEKRLSKAKALDKDCTFKPEISKMASKSRPDAPEGQIFERMFSQVWYAACCYY